MKLMTWNMQGAGTSTSPKAKWEALADWLLDQNDEDRPDIVALQECGVLPDKLPGESEYVSEFSPGGWPVTVYRWTAESEDGERQQDFYVSYAELDAGAHRVNLAVLSAAEPDDAATTFAETRPGLGLFFDDTWYFSIHASAAYGWDVEDLLANIWTTVGDGPWVALGDYNKEPQDILWNGEVLSQPTHDCDLNSVEPDHYTHPRSPDSESPERVIDYAVQTGNLGIAPAERLDMGYSDHYAVLFS
ncbi:MAG: endonuclease/exonuclease/phosphatase family protein [Paludibacterium sp.]|uniref:endonuclease/exonuclease/phosphatase family protein n=1 Tax=Paludibacterium sp. TaxID=1917523 RepID=UPI0025DFFA92|nr:endonuclease/exonuclease/phosphatase family protein [Paludibacterium sp.]MBV8048635.1 endonuclease/exonuclease/phosphatase family protein [Paludibacterium sp.]MBV8645828.1 endonuclease/exonuclease/phosphatase family protein [Paludibacterium sp.]